MSAVRPIISNSTLMPKIWLALAAITASTGLWAQEDIAGLTARGEELFFERISCWICHGENAEGLLGPSLQHGPTPMEIQAQLDSNPQMTVIVSELNPDAEDLLAIATYIRDMNDIAVSADEIAAWRGQLAEMAAARGPEAEVFLTERDKLVMQIQSFDTVLADWQPHANSGSLKRDYQVQELATFDSGEQVFHPEPGELYFYMNTAATHGRPLIDFDETPTNTSQVVVGDARTKEVIVYSQLPAELRGAVHTTVLSPDGRYVYIVGPGTNIGGPALTGSSELRTSATLLKVDALSLRPIKQLAVGGRLHHGQVFQDRYLLMDTFTSDPDGLNVFLFDPETDKIIGGVSRADLGGLNYTSYTDDEFIYILMSPSNVDTMRLAAGEFTVMRPFWVAKLDPETWEVVAEYPYSGYRGDWIIIDSNSEYMYIPAALSDNVTKVNLLTGAIEWAAPTGSGPYGGTLNADESQIWVSNKGETSGFLGRTITVIDSATGRLVDTLFSGYMADHVLLSPDGTEMWVTSNAEGSIYVFDPNTREQLKVIPMPHRGEPHGTVWVTYDENGEGAVIRDQGGFHNGVHPARGNPLVLADN